MAEQEYVTIPQLPGLSLAISTFLEGSNADGKSGKFTMSDLSAFIAPYVQGVAVSGLVFPAAGTPTVLPTPAGSGVYATILGAGTYTQAVGGNIVVTGMINVLAYTSGSWKIISQSTIQTDDFLKKQDFGGQLGQEIYQGGTLENKTYGKPGGAGVTGNDALSTYFRLTTPDVVVSEDCHLTEISFYLGVAGPVTFGIGTASSTVGFKLRKTLAPLNGVVGLNTLQVSDYFFTGESLVLVPQATSARINYTQGTTDPITGSSMFVQLTTGGTFGTAPGYYAYSFKVQSGLSPLYYEFISKNEGLSEVISREVQKDYPLTSTQYGVERSASIQTEAGSSDLYAANEPGILSSSGVVRRLFIQVQVPGAIQVVIGTPGASSFTIRKTISTFSATKVGWNEIPLNELVYTGEAVAIGGANTQAKIVYENTGGPTEYRLTQYHKNSAKVQGPAGSYYAMYFTVDLGVVSPFDPFLTNENLQRGISDYLATDQISSTKVNQGVIPTNTGEIGPYSDNRYLTIPTPSPFDAKVKKITILVGGVPTPLTFSVGLIDQYSRWIEDRTFQVMPTLAGVNTFLVDQLLKEGQQLAIKTPSNPIGIKSGGSGYIASSAAGYNSTLTFVNGVDLCFQYEIYEHFEKKIIDPAEFEEVKQEIAAISNKPTIIKSTPAGKLFRLTCDDDGTNIRTLPAYPLNMAVLGNSITKHPITSFWWGEWGMAASQRANDFVHVMQTSLQQVSPTSVITGYNIADYEANHSTYNKALLNPMLSGKDFVLLRIGENVSNLTNYQADLESLIDYIKGYVPNATIAMTGCFWANSDKESAMVAAANSRNIQFIQLYQLETPENKSFIGAQVYGDDNQYHTVNNSGVANHPGDLGMSRIASTIYNSLF